jgi:hypothetical protein
MSAAPAWDKVKQSGRRSISHADAVMETVLLQKQSSGQWKRSGHMAADAIDLYEILRTLSDKKIPFVLIGAHSISGWTGRPRNTLDVDILVKAGRNFNRAVSAIKALYPLLESKKFTGLTGFFRPGETQSLIDVVQPHQADLAETLTSDVWVENEEHGVRYRIPSLESALASKYGAMLNPTRPVTKRMQDATDFAFMVEHTREKGRREVDLGRLEILGEMVWPGGDGEEIVQLVAEVKEKGFVDLSRLFKDRV